LLVVQDGDDTPDVVDGDHESRTVTNSTFLDAQILRRRRQGSDLGDAAPPRRVHR
jgi:hypothetical protein